ncbi:hypothetical protein RIF29_38528 [Crotalaria pallida]|uniref:Uncharacterized protein n=1 Tax=Crotalaria pallida TaxID=3830 RepID=A0AAN9DZH0_CROPI
MKRGRKRIKFLSMRRRWRWWRRSRRTTRLKAGGGQRRRDWSRRMARVEAYGGREGEAGCAEKGGRPRLVVVELIESKRRGSSERPTWQRRP